MIPKASAEDLARDLEAEYAKYSPHDQFAVDRQLACFIRLAAHWKAEAEKLDIILRHMDDTVRKCQARAEAAERDRDKLMDAIAKSGVPCLVELESLPMPPVDREMVEKSQQAIAAGDWGEPVEDLIARLEKEKPAPERTWQQRAEAAEAACAAAMSAMESGWCSMSPQIETAVSLCRAVVERKP